MAQPPQLPGPPARPGGGPAEAGASPKRSLLWPIVVALGVLLIMAVLFLGLGTTEDLDPDPSRSTSSSPSVSCCSGSTSAPTASPPLTTSPPTTVSTTPTTTKPTVRPASTPTTPLPTKLSVQCQMSPASPRQGQTVAITFTIDSPNSRTVGLGVGVYADGSENDDRATGTGNDDEFDLSPRRQVETLNVVLPENQEAGTYEIVAQLYPANRIGKTNTLAEDTCGFMKVS
jgi:hypothetical protein